jgi:hypothetical protein
MEYLVGDRVVDGDTSVNFLDPDISVHVFQDYFANQTVFFTAASLEPAQGCRPEIASSGGHRLARLSSERVARRAPDISGQHQPSP